MLEFRKGAEFVKSAKKRDAFPLIVSSKGSPLPEVAIVGRSNVGKSSLLNHLFQSKNLVKTSSKPGKTQLLNFFRLGDSISFVDLPGFGFALVPPEIKREFRLMVEDYFKSERCKLVLFLWDIRRAPKEEDIELIESLQSQGTPLILIFTKTDKLTLNEKNTQAKRLKKAFFLDEITTLCYSIYDSQARVALINEIEKKLFN